MTFVANYPAGQIPSGEDVVTSMEAVTGVSGSYPLPANTFTAPEGKVFGGWAASANGAAITETTITVTEDTTLYAVWTETAVTPDEP